MKIKSYLLLKIKVTEEDRRINGRLEYKSNCVCIYVRISGRLEYKSIIDQLCVYTCVIQE